MKYTVALTVHVDVEAPSADAAQRLAFDQALVLLPRAFRQDVKSATTIGSPHVAAARTIRESYR